MVRFHRGSPAKNKASLLGGFAFGVPGSEFQVPSETFKSKEQATEPPVWGAFSFVSIVTANPACPEFVEGSKRNNEPDQSEVRRMDLK